jgi:hypothetical protein
MYFEMTSMKRPLCRFALVLASCSVPVSVAAGEPQNVQYILAHCANSKSITRQGFEEIKRALPVPRGARIRIGTGFIFSYLQSRDEPATRKLQRFLDLARQTDLPVLVELDGELVWGDRPDLWNWWDPSMSGYDPANAQNVEWTGWGPEHAVKLCWRNWGFQFRVLPAPNLMSPLYRQAVREGQRPLVDMALAWWKDLPPAKKHLLIGIKVGHESSIGVNAWHYPGGNDLWGRPSSEDPPFSMKPEEVPARGVAQTGYAAVKTAGIRSEGAITEADIAEVVRRHLWDMCREAARAGVPRDKLFTHSAAWKDGELLYGAPVNEFSCPGWSFYKHAGDPRKDVGAQRELKRSDAPYWGAVEWLYLGPRELDPWRQALSNTLVDRRCRLLSIYNWEGFRDSKMVVEAIRQVVADSVVADEGSVDPTGGQNASRLADNKDGTVTDTFTGLMWMKNSVDTDGHGQKPAPHYPDLCEALAYCENLTFAGHDDWRLPNLRELHSLVDYGRANPAIDPVFGALPRSLDTTYWSSTTVTAIPDSAWLVFFDLGRVSSYEFEHRKRDGSYARAVRSLDQSGTGLAVGTEGGRNGGSGLPKTGQHLCYDAKGTRIDCASETCAGQDGFYQAGCPSEARFDEGEDGTVLDTCTGLVWQKETADINDDGNMDPQDAPEWREAVAYCENLTLAGHDDWRLPSLNELQSLVDYGRSHPAMDPVFDALATFPTRAYWSSTAITHAPDFAWLVFFDYGRVSSIGGDHVHGHVRAVRRTP